MIKSSSAIWRGDLPLYVSKVLLPEALIKAVVTPPEESIN
jgi:hypothetical protein